MHTRFYDSAEPGPPHGWLDGNQGLSAEDQTVWDNVASITQQTGRRLAPSLSIDSSSQIWGTARTSGRWWIYHVTLAGEDRFGRPGRTLTVIFCTDRKENFDWGTIIAVSPEMKALSKDRNLLDSLQQRSGIAQSSTSLIDDFLKLPATPLVESLKAEMSCLLDRLEDGCHENFTITENGTVSNYTLEEISPKQPFSLPQPPVVREEAPKPHKTPMTKALASHTLCLAIGFLLGVALAWHFTQKTPAPSNNQPEFHSVEEAITHLRTATDYLERSLNTRSGRSSSIEHSPALKNRSSDRPSSPN